MPKITPFLYFNGDAEQAVKFYRSIFKKTRIERTTYYNKAGAKATGLPVGSVMTIEFELEGQQFIALNGGSAPRFNEAVSFFVHCKTQAEVDRYWKKLTAGGEEIACSWLRDKYGLAWQIVPTMMLELLGSKDTAKAERVMAAMMKMTKLDIKKLKAAAAGKQ